MEIKRRKTRLVNVGGIKIGSSYPITVQSMAKTRTKDISDTVRQIRRLKKAGCEIVRVAVKDKEDAKSIKEIKKRIDLPLVADIHFHYTLALEAIKNGADKVRLNPGNIFKVDEIREVVSSAKKHKIPIRVGLNSGSVNPVRSKSPEVIAVPLVRTSNGIKMEGSSIAESMVKACLNYLKILEGMDFRDIVISLKASDLSNTLDAYRKMSLLCDYPFHLGITASGLPQQGLVKSSIGIAMLLSEGIGDTIRVSLTSSPVDEVFAAREILNALDLRKFGTEVVSCPTCGRCEVDLVNKVKAIEEKLSSFDNGKKMPKKIAIMGCVVNGPGEARQADLGVAFGKKYGLVFKNGKIVKKVPQEKVVDYILQELNSLC